MNSENIKLEIPKEWAVALLVASKNYKNRIEYLEKEHKISDYKLNRIKQTTLYDLEKSISYFEDLLRK